MELHDASNSAEHQAKLEQLVVMADPVKIGQVVRNIVSNSIKFTPTDGSVDVKGA
jgi:signal transduction histidine kinase